MPIKRCAFVAVFIVAVCMSFTACAQPTGDSPGCPTTATMAPSGCLAKPPVTIAELTQPPASHQFVNNGSAPGAPDVDPFLSVRLNEIGTNQLIVGDQVIMWGATVCMEPVPGETPTSLEVDIHVIVANGRDIGGGKLRPGNCVDLASHGTGGTAYAPSFNSLNVDASYYRRGAVAGSSTRIVVRATVNLKSM